MPDWSWNNIRVHPCYITLVELVGRAFYEDVTTAKGGNRPKSGRSDNRGIAVVVLDRLTWFEWVREDELAKDLKLQLKQLRRILRFLEEEKLITREHRIEKPKALKTKGAAADTTDKLTGKDKDEKTKLCTHSYCCLDYAQICDVVRYRLHLLKKQLKDELDSKTAVQEYVCPKCVNRYTALDAIRLVSFEDDSFHCERCNARLVAETDNLGAQEKGGRDGNARNRRHEKLKALLQMMEAELKPLMHQLNIVKNLEVPNFGTLEAWELQAKARAANGDSGSNSTFMPFFGETKVEVAFSSIEENRQSIKSENKPAKVLPPWMIKQGTNLTQDQSGMVKQELKMEESSSCDEFKDEKSISQENVTKNLQDEYFKAYYAALLQRQQELEASKRKQESCTSLSAFVGATYFERQVGMKSKRDDHEDVEWEKAPSAGKAFPVMDSNVEANLAGGEENDYDVDWEEG